MASEDKIKEGAQQFLEPGEEVLAAFVARPRGWTQKMAGARPLGSQQVEQAGATAASAGFQLGSPMALAITQRRLLSLGMGAQVGMGIGGGVTELLSAVPLSEVNLVKVKRLLVGSVVEVGVRGQTFKLEAGAGANAKGVAEAFQRSRGA